MISIQLMLRVGKWQFPLGVNRGDKDAPNASGIQANWNLSKGMSNFSLWLTLKILLCS